MRVFLLDVFGLSIFIINLNNAPLRTQSIKAIKDVELESRKEKEKIRNILHS
jgi:hypothetical protein